MTADDTSFMAAREKCLRKIARVNFHAAERRQIFLVPE
jgi:hypothetical protein